MTKIHSDLSNFDILDSETQQCPHAHYALMRESCPVLRTDAAGTEIFLVSRYEDVMKVLMDPQVFSSKFGQSGLPISQEVEDRITEVQKELNAYPRMGTLLTADPPEHTRYRKLVSRAFTAKAIADLEPFIRELSNNLIDGFIAEGSCEFV
ncbi:MAG TPA: cytochrome P450, partial [Gemmatimonadetes bacterium]|nr:cytochrome P450 [Gemmatimonadota bacterium]